ncbi:MAG TPA: hypothetical protein PKG48_11655, partial [Bacteroidales bacterium]|nr:hypothetical protein [Bacteroidales bacterium]
MTEVLIDVIPVHAEGSKDLYPAGASGRRAYLLSRNIGTTPATFDPFPAPGTMRVYVVTGDTIYVGSSMQGKNYGTGSVTGTINLRAPNGNTYTSGTSTTVGLIANRTEELNGPDRGSMTAGYTPFYRVVAAAEAGIWEVDFVSMEATGSSGTNLPQHACPTSGDHLFDNDFAATYSWTGTGTTGQPVASGSAALILAWDISVGSTVTSGQLKTGRVYQNVVGLTLPNNYPPSGGFYGKYYILTNDGYAYRVNSNGLNGASWNFFSNNKGVVTGGTLTNAGYAGGTPTFKSQNSVGSTSQNTFDPR